jgi:hypothetical protein
MRIQKLQRSGNQTVVNIPKVLCDLWDWYPGMYVKVLTNEKDVVIIVKLTETERKTYKGRPSPGLREEEMK